MHTPLYSMPLSPFYNRQSDACKSIINLGLSICRGQFSMLTGGAGDSVTDLLVFKPPTLLLPLNLWDRNMLLNLRVLMFSSHICPPLKKSLSAIVYNKKKWVC